MHGRCSCNRKFDANAVIVLVVFLNVENCDATVIVFIVLHTIEKEGHIIDIISKLNYTQTVERERLAITAF